MEKIFWRKEELRGRGPQDPVCLQGRKLERQSNHERHIHYNLYRYCHTVSWRATQTPTQKDLPQPIQTYTSQTKGLMDHQDVSEGS